MKKYILLLITAFTGLQALAQTGLNKGDTAPLFTAVDNSGKTIDLKKELKKHHAVVLFFYRGQWCPYCNKHIKELQDSLQLLTAKDAYVIGVTPETKDNISKTVEKTKASFTIVQDKGYAIMKNYKVNYILDDGTLAQYKNYGIDINANNGNADHVLPVPATYIINQAGKITFVHFNKDYTKRPSVKEIMAAL